MEAVLANPIATAVQMANHALRFGWYWGVNQLVDRELARAGAVPRTGPTRPVPTRQEILGDVAALIQQDAAAVGAGVLPPMSFADGAARQHWQRLRRMFADLPETARRRHERDTATAAASDPGTDELPDYFRQDFHFQSGGYLTEHSAQLYDVQVETLFYGTAELMRRAALGPVADAMRGRDQRRVALLDVACGTGRLLREIRLAWPALRLTGLDLSRAYLAEAERHMAGLRPATLLVANAEAIPLADASQDMVTTSFLFHELPPDVRRRVVGEMARVLRPGGWLVLIDSLQIGDRSGWDGLLEMFPERFHEPYYRSYLIDDLAGMLTQAGFEMVSTSTAFLARRVVCRKS